MDFIVVDEISEWSSDQINFSLERMKMALESGTVRLPSNLTREQRRWWILNAGKVFDRKDYLSDEELTLYAVEMYEKHHEEDYFNIEDWECKQYKYAEESDLPVRENYKRRKEK